MTSAVIEKINTVIYRHKSMLYAVTKIHQVDTSLKNMAKDGASHFSNANFPVDEEGRVYHLGLKRGEVANRILTVGDPKRAELISGFLDQDAPITVVQSKRGFHTYTGHFNSVPVSIISIGMGRPMMDFMIREARSLIDGPMILIRLGTCGTPRLDVGVGCVAVATGAIEVVRLCDSFEEDEKELSDDNSTGHWYHISKKPCMADAELSDLLTQYLKDEGKDINVLQGINATADSFYSSQGRLDSNFDDHNDNLLKDILVKHPNVLSLEMETYQLFHMARLAKPIGTMRAAAVALILANRVSNAMLDYSSLRKLERQAGFACLKALTRTPLSPDAHVAKKQRKQ